MPLKTNKKKKTTKKKTSSHTSSRVDEVGGGVIYQKFIDYVSMFYGAAGVGKTQFVHALLNKRVLWISTDRGTRCLPVEKHCRHEVDSWEEVEEAIEYLQQNPGQFDLVCVDHVDDVAFFAEENICLRYDIESADELSHGKYWRDLKKRWLWLIHNIKRAKVGIVFIAHDTTKEVKIRGRKINRTMPLIGKTTWKVLLPLVQLLGHIYIEYDTRAKKDVRMLQTQPSDSVEAKDRTTRRKPADGYELLDSTKFLRTFNTGG